MPIQVEFRILKDQITPALTKLITQFPDKVAEVTKEMARIGQRNLRREITRQGITDTGKLWKGVEARYMSKYRSGVFIPQYGAYLDSMSPHYVSLKRGRKVTNWTKRHMPLKRTHGGSRIYTTKRGIVKGALLVYPHPWIDLPAARTAARFDSVVDKKLNEAFNNV